MTILLTAGLTFAFLFPIGCCFFAWIITGLAGGFFAFPCHVMEQVGCPGAFFVMLFYPITALIGFFYVLVETKQTVGTILGEYFKGLGEALGGLWVGCSPY